MVVVVVPERRALPNPRQFAAELFNYWEIGKPPEDNGVLLLINPRWNQIEIIRSQVLEKILPTKSLGVLISDR